MPANRKPSRSSSGAKNRRPNVIRVKNLHGLWRLTQPVRTGHSYDVAFRGDDEVCGEPALVPQLMRSKALQRNEVGLLRNFKRYAERYSRERGQTEWGWLALAQHHGLPTRLLDWTFSSLVALHFITCDASKHRRNGVLWQVDLEEVKKTLPPDLRSCLAKVRAIVFTEGMLGKKFPRGLDQLDETRDRQEGFVVFFEPPSLDDRIINQFGLFSVAPKRFRSLCPLLSRKGLLKKIIIPARLKKPVRNYLDRNNITERTLFPGLEGIADYLGRHYVCAGRNRDALRFRI